ncbi:MAG: hypothetical protein IJO28_05925 [Oscillospiraceae bacterium]|nr:hypothetical protein [Oscillospiraceae bacterium]
MIKFQFIELLLVSNCRPTGGAMLRIAVAMQKPTTLSGVIASRQKAAWQSQRGTLFIQITKGYWEP